MKNLLSFLFPQTCRFCRELVVSSEFLCVSCTENIPWIGHSFCSVCGKPFEEAVNHNHPCGDCLKHPPEFSSHYSAVFYDDVVRNVIHQLKYGAAQHMLPLLAQWVLKKYISSLVLADYLVPVPLSSKRLSRRTFNQSLELSRLISKKTGIPLIVHGLQKIKETPAQTQLNRKKREENLEGAFIWKGRSLRDKTVLLIDDVYSTGSTLNACARALKSSQPDQIMALTVAYNPGRSV